MVTKNICDLYWISEKGVVIFFFLLKETLLTISFDNYSYENIT